MHILYFYLVLCLLFLSLKYFTGDNKHYIDWEDVWFAALLTNAKVGNISRKNDIYFSKYDDFFYYNENEEYLNKNSKKSEKVKAQYNEISNLIKDYNEEFIQKLNRFLS